MKPLRLLVPFLLMLTVAAAAPPAASSAPGADDAIVATFEDASTAVTTSPGLTVTTSADAPAEGQHCLSITASAGAGAAGKSSMRLRLPDSADPSGHEALVASLRAPQLRAPLDLRWQAMNATGQPLFMRRFKLQPGERWVRIEEPLRSWRWDDTRVGDWDEVKQLALVIDSSPPQPPAHIDLDDVRFVGHETIDQRAAWLMDLAFEKQPRKQAAGDGLLVATDAVDVFTDAQLQKLLDDMRRARKFVRRVFGDAVRPTEHHDAPVALLIFKEADEYPRFIKNFGDALRVQIAPPSSGGYTVQDVASSTYKADQGPRRPVYLHESVHAIITRDVRLITGHAPHTPLQEAAANYVQIAVFPNSLPAGAYPRNFAKPIDPSGNGFFKPLEMLFTQKTTSKEYAQLASIFAYLVEKDPPLLRDLARGLADGRSAADVLTARKTTWAALQSAWLAWGKQRFANAGGPSDAVFPTPAEFR